MTALHDPHKAGMGARWIAVFSIYVSGALAGLFCESPWVWVWIVSGGVTAGFVNAMWAEDRKRRHSA